MGKVAVLECLYWTEFSPRTTVPGMINGKVISGNKSPSFVFNSWSTFKARKYNKKLF